MQLQETAPDPSARRITCEACGSDAHESGAPLRVGNSYSLLAVWATTGGEPIAGAGVVSGGVGCGAEQHFCCSAACAIRAHVQCLEEHLRPRLQTARQRVAELHQRHAAGGETNGNQ